MKKYVLQCQFICIAKIGQSKRALISAMGYIVWWHLCLYLLYSVSTEIFWCR